MREYKFKEIENKWQNYWKQNKLFKANDFDEKEKFYCLIEFPYPSGEALHVGHLRPYTALDILVRKKRMENFNVLFPMGFDSFGLPAENYAIKTGIHPSVITKQNIERYIQQLKNIGCSFDWDRVISSSDPNFFKWTQWIFLKLFEKGFAYKAGMPINWCTSCKIGLANEEVVNGKCERCEGQIEKRYIEQWMLKITAYADRLIDDLNELDYIDVVKTQQKNWIGRSEGASVTFKLDVYNADIEVFTTRPDTLFGATYMVLAPEHKLVNKITTIRQKDSVREYCRQAARMSDLERTELNTEKTGVFTGAFAINPVNNEKIPIWISDYVLATYGTGAIMAVPAHDARDFEFAEKFNIPIKCIICPDSQETEKRKIAVEDVLAGKVCWTEYGKLINSSNNSGLNLNGLDVEIAKKKTTEWLKKNNLGDSTVNFKLRDWVFSRQRYWGEPIPLVNCSDCGCIPIPENELPLELPKVDNYQPSDTGESPLANITDWVNTKCPKCGKAAKRETDTMPGWAGSSWYFLRYLDPYNDNAFADMDKMKYWMEVDWYNGGMEHTTLHLLYSRFWYKFMYDCGLVPTSEPYKKRTSHGMILGENGEKMSKSRGNVVNPDDIIKDYGADTLRLYEMFIGPFEQVALWDTKGIAGIERFIRKVWNLAVNTKKTDCDLTKEQKRVLHFTIKKVTEDIDSLNHNTAISQMMIFINEFSKANVIPRKAIEEFVKILSPYAPHSCEEIWSIWGNENSIITEEWPEYKEEFIKQDKIEIAVQVSGKVRTRIIMAVDISREEMKTIALDNPKIVKSIEGKNIIKVICVPGRLVNIVIS